MAINVKNISNISCSMCVQFIKWIPVVVILGAVGWSYYVYVIRLCLSTMGNYTEGTVYLVPYHVLLLMVLWSYYQTVMTPMGQVPEQFRLSPADEERFISTPDRWDFFLILEDHVVKHRLPVHTRRRASWRYCLWCRRIQPDRCHHCLACNTCVLKKDHHCPWVGPEGQIYAHVVALFFVSTVLGVSLTSLLIFHYYLVLWNQSTYEFIWPPKFDYGKNKDAYSMTSYTNFCEVFGDSKLKWFLPVFTSLGDGVTFHVSPLLIGDKDPVTRDRDKDSVTRDLPTTASGSSASLGNGSGPGGQDSQGLMGPPRWQDDEPSPAQKYTNSQSGDCDSASDVRLMCCHHDRGRMTTSSSEPAIYVGTVP